MKYCEVSHDSLPSADVNFSLRDFTMYINYLCPSPEMFSAFLYGSTSIILSYLPFLYIHIVNVVPNVKGGGRIEIHLFIPYALTYEPSV
jgi:hypothetical protein